MNRLSYPEFLSRRSDFDRAVERTPEIAKFCSSSAWQCAADGLLHVSESGKDPAYLFANEGDNWLAFAEREQRGIWFPLESAWMFGCPLIGDPEQCLNLLREIAPSLNRPVGFCLGGVRDQSRLHLGLRALQSQCFRSEEFPATDCMVIDLSDGSYEDWLKRRSKKFRKSIRQLKSDEIEIEEASDDSPDEVFRRILAIQRETYKWQEGTDIFQSENYAPFYRYLVEALSEAGNLRLLFARLGEKDVAYILGAEFANQYRGLQMSYVESVRSTGIGNRLQIENLRRCASDGLQAYDLGMHSEYKERWADRREVFKAVFVVL